MVFRVLAFYKFGIGIQHDIIAEGSCREAGGDTEIRTFDRSCYFETGNGLLLLILHSTIQNGIQGDGLCYAMQGQITRYLVILTADILERGALESEGAEFGGVEEGIALQVCVSLLHACVEAVHIGGQFDHGIGEVIFGRSEGSADGAESAIDLIDRHVGDPEI